MAVEVQVFPGQLADTLAGQYAALQRQRERTMPPDELAVNVGQRRLLVETAHQRRVVRAGDEVPDVSLPEVDGGTVRLGELLAQGPLVLIFFRFAGCPACNIALPHYERTLQPGLAALGASILALSPQVPERLAEIKHRHALSFPVASDLGNALARRFDIVYSFDEPSRQLSLRKGKPIGEVTGTGTWELPLPAAIVIDPSRIVRFADVSPDWLDRTESATILEAVRSLRRGAPGR